MTSRSGLAPEHTPSSPAPEHAGAQRVLALRRRGAARRGQVAEQHYRRALDADPRNVFALCSLAGVISDARGSAEEAARLYDRALEAPPRALRIHLCPHPPLSASTFVCIHLCPHLGECARADGGGESLTARRGASPGGTFALRVAVQLRDAAARWAPPPPPRTKWTRRVHHPVLIGHAASLSQARAACGGARDVRARAGGAGGPPRVPRPSLRFGGAGTLSSPLNAALTRSRTTRRRCATTRGSAATRSTTPRPPRQLTTPSPRSRPAGIGRWEGRGSRTDKEMRTKLYADERRPSPVRGALTAAPHVAGAVQAGARSGPE